MPDRRDSSWELSLTGELSDKHSELVTQFVECPMRSKGTLWIDSCGGSVYAGLAITSIIRLRGLQVTAVVAGECSSAALLPFAACSKRYVTPHSTLLFHPMRWQSEEDVQLEQATEWARHFKALEENLDELLARLLGISEDQLAAWCRPGRFVSGPECVEAGLAELLTLFDGTLQQQLATKRSQST
jgi:ATP-dependent protease ClpP protease subunit